MLAVGEDADAGGAALSLGAGEGAAAKLGDGGGAGAAVVAGALAAPLAPVERRDTIATIVAPTTRTAHVATSQLPRSLVPDAGDGAGEDTDALDSCVGTRSSPAGVSVTTIDAAFCGALVGCKEESLSMLAIRALRSSSVSLAITSTQSPILDAVASGVASSSARAISRAVGKRLAGSTLSPRIVTSSSAGGRPGAYRLGGTSHPLSTRSRTCASFSPSKRRLPVSASQRTTDAA